VRPIVLLGTTVAVATAFTYAPFTSLDPEQQINEIFAAYNRMDSPGCAVGVIHNGQLVFERGYGMASLELGVPNSPQTVFYVGSTSKQFVAAAALLASIDGYLSLDDDIRKYVPEIPDYGTPITVRHLIHHTSGLRDYLGLMSMGGWPFEDVYTDQWTIDLIARQRALNFEPGDRYLYSNSGYFILAEIVGRATGSSLREYADRRIFQPLGMVHTHFHDDRGMVVPNRAMAYSPDDDNGFRLRWFTNFDKVGSGGLLTTVEDLLLWDRNFYHDQLADGTFTDRMLVRGVLNDGEELDYAFGLRHGEHRGLETIRHGGAFMGFRAEHLRFPEEGLSVTVLCNLASTQPSRLADQVADIFLEEQLVESPSDEAPMEETPAFVTLPGETLNALAGGYQDTERRRVWRLSAKDGSLIVEGGPLPLTLSPLDEHHFVAVDAPVPIEVYFIPDASGFSVSVRGVAWGAFEPVELATPTTEQLARYSGRYYSEELDAHFTIAVDDSVLTVQRRRLEPETAEPTAIDAFQMSGMIIEFSSSGDQVTGFALTSGRVRGVRFIRRQE
jgi:CubicO group peptidase (beta-lactamase class C family)